MSHANDEPPNALRLSRYQLRLSVSERARLKMRTDWIEPLKRLAAQPRPLIWKDAAVSRETLNGKLLITVQET